MSYVEDAQRLARVHALATNGSYDADVENGGGTSNGHRRRRRSAEAVQPRRPVATRVLERPAHRRSGVRARVSAQKPAAPQVVDRFAEESTDSAEDAVCYAEPPAAVPAVVMPAAGDESSDSAADALVVDAPPPPLAVALLIEEEEESGSSDSAADALPAETAAVCQRWRRRRYDETVVNERTGARWRKRWEQQLAMVERAPGVRSEREALHVFRQLGTAAEFYPYAAVDDGSVERRLDQDVQRVRQRLSVTFQTQLDTLSRIDAAADQVLAVVAARYTD